MKLIVGNHKMNLNIKEIDEYVEFFKEKNYSNVYFAPTSIYLTKFLDNNLNTVSQDVSSFNNGAYTGDVSTSQLKSIGISYSIVGHSERRNYYHDDEFVNDKIIRLLEHDMYAILCIGEHLEERENNSYIDVLKGEIDSAFKGIKKEFLSKVIIAYEPIWSIGTGKVPENKDIEEVVSIIKDFIKENYNTTIKVLYGGSVNNNNIDTLEEIKNIDGYLVGGCSLKINEFNELIEKVKLRFNHGG